jgi:hypothetical protein
LSETAGLQPRHRLSSRETAIEAGRFLQQRQLVIADLRDGLPVSFDRRQ